MLTEVGRLLYRYALEALRLMDEAEMALAKMSKTVQGSLRIGASSIPGQYIAACPREVQPKLSESRLIVDTR